jgi:hypothetical protein
MIRIRTAIGIDTETIPNIWNATQVAVRRGVSRGT